MPICKGKDEQGDYITWSHKTGKKYRPDEEGGEKGALAKARKQAAAAHASGYESDRDRCMRKGETQVKAEVFDGGRAPRSYLREDTAGTVPSVIRPSATRAVVGAYYGSSGVVAVEVASRGVAGAHACGGGVDEAAMIDAFLRG